MQDTGPSQALEITWEKREEALVNPEFSDRTGPSVEVLSMEDKSLIEPFLFLFEMTLMETIVFQTNLYATQKKKPFNSLNLSEFLKFLGINLLMGIKRIPSYRDYLLVLCTRNA
ncbi:hypothetical protein X975_04463, partial [Stegodyphus mimosarum]